MSTSGKEKSFKCNQCQKAYEYQKGLYKHISIAHNGKRFTCTNCQKKYKSKDKLIYHQFSAKHSCQTTVFWNTPQTTNTWTQTTITTTALSNNNVEPLSPTPRTNTPEQAQPAYSTITGRSLTSTEAIHKHTCDNITLLTE